MACCDERGKKDKTLEFHAIGNCRMLQRATHLSALLVSWLWSRLACDLPCKSYGAERIGIAKAVIVKISCTRSEELTPLV